MKAKPYTITIQQLIKLNACDHQLRLIEKEFGKTIELTKENIEKATKIEFDVGWLVKLLVNPEHIEEYETKYREYNSEWTNACSLDEHDTYNGGDGSACKERGVIFMRKCLEVFIPMYKKEQKNLRAKKKPLSE